MNEVSYYIRALAGCSIGWFVTWLTVRFLGVDTFGETYEITLLLLPLFMALVILKGTRKSWQPVESLRLTIKQKYYIKTLGGFVAGWLVTYWTLQFFGFYGFSPVTILVPVAVGVYVVSRLQQGKRNLLNFNVEPEPVIYRPLKKSEHWADDVEEIKRKLNADKYPSRLNIGAKFEWSDHGNILTVGGARGGKGVNLILPALLDPRLQNVNAPSFVVLDPKGENCAVSAAYLKSIGYDVQVINPFNIPEVKQFGQARVNPFDMFNVYTEDFSKYVDMIAFSLIPPSKKDDSTWDNAGRKLIRFYIGHMMTASDEPKTFTTLYEWMHYGGKKRDDLLDEMSKNMALGGVIAAGAWAIIGHLGDDAGKMVAGMYETAQAALSVFDDLRLRHTVSGSDFTLQTLTQKRTATFICINPSDLRRVGTWMRIIFNTILDGLPNFYNPNRKVVILMDEFPTVGRLQSFENNFAFLPGYNVTLWPIVQDLNQLKTHYPDSWETFIGSAQIKHWLAIGDNFTADYVSARMPKVKDFRNENEKSGQLKPLLEPWEVRNVTGIITEIKGYDKFIEFAKVPYWEQSDNGADNPFR